MSRLINADLEPQQEAILWELMCRPLVTADELVEAVWPDVDEQPETWYMALGQRIHGLRRAIQPHGWAIGNRHGRGWFLLTSPNCEGKPNGK